MTTSYIGTLTATASPMTRQEYNDHRGWTLPGDECGDDPGYIVTISDTGHVSWLPAAVFHSIYKEAQ